MPVAVEVSVNATGPNTSVRIEAEAAATTACAELYSGNGGVTLSGVHVGSAIVASLPSVSPLRMAVMGRQRLYVNFAFHGEMIASANAICVSAMPRAACQRSRTWFMISRCATRVNTVGGLLIQSRASVVWSAVRTALVAEP